MTYDAIIFDFDGVLISGRRTPDAVYERATRAVLEAYGAEDPEAWEDSLERPADAETFRASCDRFDLPPDEAWAYREAASTLIEESWLDRGDRGPFSDAVILEDLAQSYAIGIASNNRHALVGRCVDRFGWDGIVDAYRGRYPTLEEFQHRKPDPRFIRHVIQRLAATDPLYIGDRETDIMAAERVGCDSVLIRRADPDLRVDTAPTLAVASLTELGEQLATT